MNPLMKLAASAIGLVLISSVNATQEATHDLGASITPQPEAIAINPEAAITSYSGFDGSEPTQSGRIFRDGKTSRCAPVKAYPGIWGTESNFQYRTHTLYTGRNECVTVNFDPNPGTGNDCGLYAHMSAYLGSYDPNNQSANYLGDVGSSTTRRFSFLAPAFSTIVLVVQETYESPEVPRVCNYSFSSDQLSSELSSPASVPANSIWGLAILATLLGLMGIVRRKRK